MKTQNLSSKVFSLLRGQSQVVKSFDASGNQVPNPDQAVRFFMDDPNVMVTVDSDENQIIVNTGSGEGDQLSQIVRLIRRLAHQNLMNCDVRQFGKFIQPKQFSPTASGTDQLMEFTDKMEKPVNSYLLGKVFNELDYRQGVSADQLVNAIPGSDLNDIQRALNRLVSDSKVTLDPASGGRLYLKKMEDSPLYEAFSRMFGGVKTSRQTLESVKLVVKHREAINPEVRGARARNISAIFLECGGERFRFPNNSLMGARAMARHLSEGGGFGDELGQRIVEMSGELISLREFRRYIQTNQLISESTQDSVELVESGIEAITRDLRGLAGRRTYESARSRLTASTPEQGLDESVDQLRELFTVRRFDARFESVLNIVQRLAGQRDRSNRMLEELASGPVEVYPGSGSGDLLEFSSEGGRLAWKLSDWGRRIKDQGPLSEFIQNVASRVGRGETLTEFETEITRRALSNSAPVTRTTPRPVSATRQLEEAFDRILYRPL